MTKEAIVRRKTDLQEQFDQVKVQIEQLKATANAYIGALQDCDYWLEQLEKGEDLHKEEETPPAPPQEN